MKCASRTFLQCLYCWQCFCGITGNPSAGEGEGIGTDDLTVGVGSLATVRRAATRGGGRGKTPTAARPDARRGRASRPSGVRVGRELPPRRPGPRRARATPSSEFPRWWGGEQRAGLQDIPAAAPFPGRLPRPAPPSSPRGRSLPPAAAGSARALPALPLPSPSQPQCGPSRQPARWRSLRHGAPPRSTDARASSTSSAPTSSGPASLSAATPRSNAFRVFARSCVCSSSCSQCVSECPMCWLVREALPKAAKAIRDPARGHLATVPAPRGHVSASVWLVWLVWSWSSRACRGRARGRARPASRLSQ